jgi:integrase
MQVRHPVASPLVRRTGRRVLGAPRPARRRRGTWAASARRFSLELRSDSSIGNGWRRRVLYEIQRAPALLLRVGVRAPLPRPDQFRALHVDQLKRGLPWSPATFTVHFTAVRRFLRWAGNPLADDRGVWALPAEATGRRRWLAPDQLVRLYRAARGRERILLALEGFNGLRRVEVLRLRIKDIDFDRQLLHVLGKGRHGGKWRTLPMYSETAHALRSVSANPPGESFVIPLSRSGADLVLRRVAARAGFPRLGLRVSHHDLRRTFGRLAHKAGMDLVQLKNLYGHSSLDQTVHYIGLDEDEMRAGLDRLAAFIDPLLRPDLLPRAPPKGLKRTATLAPPL